MIEDYLTYCRAAGMRTATIRLRAGYLRRAAAALPLGTATTRDLVGWIAGHDWKPETRKSARNTLRSFYAWAYDNGELPDNPAARLPAVRVPHGVPRPAPTELLQRALAEASSRDRLILGLAAFAGLRRTEIASLPWEAVTWQGLRVTGKGGRTRLVPALPRLADWLAAEATLREHGLVGDGYRYLVDPASPYVFPSHLPGEHLSPYTVGRVLTDALGAGWTGHTLRHRFATMAFAVDRDLLTVQQLLGHSKAETTATYVALPHGAATAAVAGAAA